MRHAKAGRRLGRTTSHRTAMFRNMVTSLFQHEKITTTDSKAKELKVIAEKMITLGKRGDLHAVRQAAAYIRDKKVVTKLFETIAPRFSARPGGYTRIIKIGARLGDNAPVAILELVEEEVQRKAPKKKQVKDQLSVAPIVAAVQVASTESKSETDELAETDSLIVEPAPEIPFAVVDPADQCGVKAD
jgi:large subunit ribosomal protein L17